MCDHSFVAESPLQHSSLRSMHFIVEIRFENSNFFPKAAGSQPAGRW
jgi:hypothetical protein